MNDDKTNQEKAEEFVRTWQAAESVAEVAEKLGLKEKTVVSRANRYRKELRVPLKKLYQRERLDPDRLREIAEDAS